MRTDSQHFAARRDPRASTVLLFVLPAMLAALFLLAQDSRAQRRAETVRPSALADPEPLTVANLTTKSLIPLMLNDPDPS